MLLFKKKDLLVVISKSGETVQFTKPLKDILKYQHRYNYKFKMYENGKVTVADDYIIEGDTLTVLFGSASVSYTSEGATYTEGGSGGEGGEVPVPTVSEAGKTLKVNNSGVLVYEDDPFIVDIVDITETVTPPVGVERVLLFDIAPADIPKKNVLFRYFDELERECYFNFGSLVLAGSDSYLEVIGLENAGVNTSNTVYNYDSEFTYNGYFFILQYGAG